MLSQGRAVELVSLIHMEIVDQGAYPAHQRRLHKLLQQRSENLAFHISQINWRRLKNEQSLRGRRVCSHSTHVLDCIKTTLMMDSEEPGPGFL